MRKLFIRLVTQVEMVSWNLDLFQTTQWCVSPYPEKYGQSRDTNKEYFMNKNRGLSETGNSVYFNRLKKQVMRIYFVCVAKQSCWL